MHTRVHILGASGSGTTTLGAALACRLVIPHHDTDDYYWLVSNPPYSLKRPIQQRLERLEQALRGSYSWALSGSLCGWGDPLIASFTAVVYLDAPTSVRMVRLQAREQARYGNRIAPGGDLYDQHVAFLSWAAEYDTGGLETRSRLRHRRWLDKLTIPVVELDGAREVESLVSQVVDDLDAVGLKG